MSQTGSLQLTPVGEAYQAAKLRWATLADADRLKRLFSEAHGDEQNADAMADWLEHGGALLLEDQRGVALSGVRWREAADRGWLLDRIATLPEARDLGFGRWLMTKVEALAIRYNVPSLTVTLNGSDELGYYRRLGYSEYCEDAGEGPLRVRKRVGGMWQMQGGLAK